jgi:hypothetical protein
MVKCMHAITLQAACDHRMRFTDCFAGYPGSVHDAHALKNSPLHTNAQHNIVQLFPNDTRIIGDAAYTLKKWLVVSFPDNGHLTRRQQNFSHKLSVTRSVVERAFACSAQGLFQTPKNAGHEPN